MSRGVENSHIIGIVLDEIQFVERFSEVLNSFLRWDNIDIYVTGSNSRFLSTDILTELQNTFHTVMQSTISDKTIKSYINYLQEAFLIDIVIRYDIKGKGILVLL